MTLLPPGILFILQGLPGFVVRGLGLVALADTFQTGYPELLFGSCMHSATTKLPYPPGVDGPPQSSLLGEFTERSCRADEFSMAVMNMQIGMGERLPLGPIHPLFELWKDNTKQLASIVDLYLEPIIAEATRKWDEEKATGNSNPEEEGDDDNTLLASMLRNTSDPVVLRDQVLNVMVAARDTTAETLTFTIYLLCQHPTILARLREEILANVGPKGRPTYDDIKEMKFLRAVLNETLRLYPIVPFNVRECHQATTWKPINPGEQPIYIPKGSVIPYSVFVLHRRKDLWGPDAEIFDPDRFIDERLQKYLIPHPTIFLPFNAGPRIYIGQGLAYGEISFFLVRLLLNFSTMELDILVQPPAPSAWAGAPGRKGAEQVNIRNHLTLFVAGGLWVKMEQAPVE